MPVLDLNADLGETPGDIELVSVVTSASIACGAHAGDAAAMREACEAAVRHGTAIGAHPGYPDRARMGRAELDLPVAAVVELVGDQVAALAACAEAAGGRVGYVKLHGALYHRAAQDAELAEALAGALAAAGLPLAVLAQPGSLFLHAARRLGLVGAEEAFCDRSYTAGGALVDRTLPGAVIEDVEQRAEQALGIAARGGVRSVDGTWVAVPARSLCLHGDSPGALGSAERIRSVLLAAGVTLSPFVP
jgi:UPF0271 protein